MKYFSTNTIQDSLSNSGIEDSFLALLCVCKVLNASQQPNLNNWMSFEKSDLVRELVYYFDFETGKIKESDGNGSLSIIFAKNYAMSFEKVNPVHLGAICFRKYGIPETINSVNELINYLKSEFCLTEDFCNEVFLRNEAALPEFDDNFSNVEFEQLLKEQNHIDNEDGFFAISCGPKKVIKNSAGALGAAYFQTLYSKMPSKVCLITEYPDEYSSFKLDGEENTRNNAVLGNFTPSQIIYYGVPGCGKSKKIMDLLDVAKLKGEITDEEKQVVRVVFHPEYTNADFVGQVMPVVKPAGGVDYDFAAGPFTRILARAYANPTKSYFLVIEEINRGNAAAIFGEIFQLLDRHKKDESDSVGGNLYTAGWSKYFVDHVDVNGIIRKEISETEYNSDEEKPTVNFTANTGIRLPPNLSIYATMNTSDQNVFTLDNAFKRRFDSELVKNTLDGEQHKAQRETKIENTDVTWGMFWEKVNNLILAKNTSMTSSEDKRLGAYFIIGEEKTDDAGNKYREVSRKLFGEKVLEYLWDDAFKYKRKEVFAESCKSVESLIENFEKGGFTAIFKDGVLGL